MKLSSYQKKLVELKAGWQRTAADFENYKKRVEREKEGWKNEAKIEVFHELLPILDNLSLAATHAGDEKKLNQWEQGIMLIAKEIDEKLAGLGIIKISPKIGEPFDHNFHEAVAAHPLTAHRSGTITKVEKNGYRMDEVVIRPAKVIVAK